VKLLPETGVEWEQDGNRDPRYPNPFPRNGCSAIALAACLGEPDAMLAATICSVLRDTKRVSKHRWNTPIWQREPGLMNSEYMASGIPADVERMLKVSGLRVVDRIVNYWPDESLRPTTWVRPRSLGWFLSTARARKGSWYCIRRGHAFAIVEGVVINNSDMNDQLLMAWRVVPEAQ